MPVIDPAGVGPWTRFGDVHSGGYPALPWEIIYVEGDEDTAIRRFQAILGRDPRNVSCDCCGSDYGWSESPTLEAASRFCRGASEDGCPDGYEPYSLAAYFALETILVLPADVTALTSEQMARRATPPETWTTELQSGSGKPVVAADPPVSPM